jgi:hypothetical protein
MLHLTGRKKPMDGMSLRQQRKEMDNTRGGVPTNTWVGPLILFFVFVFLCAILVVLTAP